MLDINIICNKVETKSQELAIKLYIHLHLAYSTGLNTQNTNQFIYHVKTKIIGEY